MVRSKVRLPLLVRRKVAELARIDRRVLELRFAQRLDALDDFYRRHARAGQCAVQHEQEAPRYQENRAGGQIVRPGGDGLADGADGWIRRQVAQRYRAAHGVLEILAAADLHAPLRGLSRRGLKMHGKEVAIGAPAAILDRAVEHLRGGIFAFRRQAFAGLVIFGCRPNPPGTRDQGESGQQDSSNVHTLGVHRR
jgi:hypothetical protein